MRDEGITFSEYQDFTDTVSIYPNHDTDLVYPVLGLVGESGEVAEKLKKFIRGGGDLDNLPEILKAELALEIGDVLFYVARIAHVCGWGLEEIALGNRFKLLNRKERGVLHGEGDHR